MSSRAPDRPCIMSKETRASGGFSADDISVLCEGSPA